MKKLLILLAMAGASTLASANCIGSPNMQTCVDSSGNSYNVQRYGNTTTVQGTNPGTGNNWSQTSNRVGNTTFHNGTAANGQSWSGTTQSIGGTTFHNGVDSRGRSYTKTCNAYGCF